MFVYIINSNTRYQRINSWHVFFADFQQEVEKTLSYSLQAQYLQNKC